MRIFFLVILIFFSHFVASGQALANIDDFGAISDDGIADTAAFQSAVDYLLERGGGTVIVGPGLYVVDGLVRIVPGQVGVDVTFEGRGSSVIQVSAGNGAIVFYAGNLNQLNFRDLTFIGRNVASGHPDFIDAGYLIFANYVLTLNVLRSNFFGVGTGNSSTGKGALIFAGSVDTVIRDSNFNGSFAPYPNGSLIEAQNFRGLIVSNSRFLDYANFQGMYFSKATSFVGSWIRASNSEDFNASQQKRVLIEDSYFDEGAAVAIDAWRVPNVTVKGVRISVNGTSPGRGIRLNKVDYAEIRQSSFGLAQPRRPAIEVVDVGGLMVSGIRFSEGVYFLMNNGLQSAKIEFCPQCGTIVQSPRKLAKPGGTFQ